jgi:hypothetical protein
MIAHGGAMRKNKSGFIPTLGFWFAVVSTLVNIFYLGVLIYNFSTFGMTFPPPEPTPTLAAIASILGAQLLIILMVILRRDVDESRRVFADLAVVFMVLLSAMTSANRYVYLSILPVIAESGDTVTVALLHSYSPTSFMWGIENLGWGLFFGLGALFVAFAFSPQEKGLRWMFGVSGVLSLLHAVGFIIRHPILTLLGFPAWGIFLPIGTVLLAIRFWRRMKAK